jgi:hypothetical protein
MGTSLRIMFASFIFPMISWYCGNIEKLVECFIEIEVSEMQCYVQFSSVLLLEYIDLEILVETHNNV